MLEADDIGDLLGKRIDSIDWQQAKADVLPFVRDPRSLDLWSADLFTEAVRRTLWVEV